MTFLELQNRIVQTRKARKGVKNREDYFDGDENEEFWNAVYKKALKAANEVIRHYENAGEISKEDKVKVVLGVDEVNKHKPINTYDPAKQYIVSREKSGRPKHVITKEEEKKIRALRADGMSINAISKEMGISNRQIMALCRSI